MPYCTFLYLQYESGWWLGTLNGKKGLFPGNYVRKPKASGEDKESSDATADKTSKTHKLSGLFIKGSATPSN